MTLAELQAQFCAAIVAGPADAPRLAASLLVDPERAAIYADMYETRLIDALRADYPKLVAHIGDDRFNGFAAAFASEHPSRFPSLRHFGKGFAAYVAGAEDTWLTPLAALEWARIDVFDERDEDCLTIAALSSLPPGEWLPRQLIRIAATRLVSTQFAVDEVWNDPSVMPTETATTLVVWRQLPNRVYHRRLDAGEVAWLDALATPHTLAELCELTADDPPEILQARFARFVSDGLVRFSSS